MSLRDTLGNPAWTLANGQKIVDLFPETWTHIGNLAGGPALKIGFGLKLLGVDWRSEDEFGRCMVFFEKVGLMRRDGLLVRRGVMPNVIAPAGSKPE